MSPISTRICVPNLVAVRQSCRKKRGGTDRQRKLQLYIVDIIYIDLYNTNSVCVCVYVSVKYRRPNGWTDHDQIWHVYADRPGNGSYQKKWSHVWSGRVGSLGPFFGAGTSCWRAASNPSRGMSEPLAK